MLWDLARDLDSATQTYLVPDLSGLLKLKTITDLTRQELVAGKQRNYTQLHATIRN